MRVDDLVRVRLLLQAVAAHVEAAHDRLSVVVVTVAVGVPAGPQARLHVVALPTERPCDNVPTQNVPYIYIYI